MIICINKRDGSNINPMDASTFEDYTKYYFMADCSGITVERHDYQKHVAMNVFGDQDWIESFGKSFADDFAKMFPLFEVAPAGKYPLLVSTPEELDQILLDSLNLAESAACCVSFYPFD